MAPSRATYDPLPTTDNDLESHPSSVANSFKDKPVQRSYHTSLRKIRRCLARTCKPLYILIFLLLALFLQLTFNNSYVASSAPKFKSDPTEKVYIAANIIDGDLISGAWGKSLLELVDRIGKDRVFVSIYGGPTSALKELEEKLPCEKSIVSEEVDPLDLGQIPRTTLPTGDSRIKRIAYLAEVRNKALAPLDKLNGAYSKVLFINDVFFDAAGAERLLWGTNINPKTEKAEFKAACAADFVTSWKYYDTFATRDVEGYSLGVPIFPWFPKSGNAISRNDVLAGKDAVRVKSCWGGMVAFDGRYFQASKSEALRDLQPPAQLPFKFRSEPEPFWDSSECCLIHSDIMSLPAFDDSIASPSGGDSSDPYDTGIYMNPYVRVSYDQGTFRWITFAKRFERLFAWPQAIITNLAHLPRWNYRRAEIEGEVVSDRVWVSDPKQAVSTPAELHLFDAEFSNMRDLGDEEKTWQGVDLFNSAPKVTEKREISKIAKRATLHNIKPKSWWREEGYYKEVNRTANRGGYCGVRQLLVMKEGKLEEGEGNWDNLLGQVPPVDL